MKMKRIALLSGMVATALIGWAGWHAASAVPQKLVVGEVPVGQSSEQYIYHTFEIGGVRFSVPSYFGASCTADKAKWIEPYNAKNVAYCTEAQLRNVYYGQCITRIDGRCGSPAHGDDTGYADFDVILQLHAGEIEEKTISVDEQVRVLNERFSQGCKTPEKVSSRSGVPISNPMIRYGDFCAYWFTYHGIIVVTRFNLGNFPYAGTQQMVQHVTAFLNKYRIQLEEKGE
jgi:hypothetical protein